VTGMDHRERLEQYRHLYESGLISADEYQRQVGRIKAAERMRLLEEGGVAALFHLEPGIAARVLTSQVFWVVLVLAMMPFVLAFIGVPPEQGMILYFAFLWFFLYLRLFRFNLIGSFSMDFAFTAFLVVFPGLALVLPALQWPGFVFGVGIAEELTKLLPVVIVLWLARRTGRRIGLQASILLGITSGLAFAGFENILYSEQYGARLFGMKFTLQGVVVSRLLMTPFLHSVWAGITGFAVGAAAAMGPGSWVRGLRIVAPWLLFAATPWSWRITGKASMPPSSTRRSCERDGRSSAMNDVTRWDDAWALDLPGETSEQILFGLVLKDLAHGASFDVEFEEGEVRLEVDFICGDELEGTTYRLLLVAEVAGPEASTLLTDFAEDVLGEMAETAAEAAQGARLVGEAGLEEIEIRVVPEDEERWDLVCPDWLAPDGAEVPFGFRPFRKASGEPWPSNADLDGFSRIVVVPTEGGYRLYGVDLPTDEEGEA